VVVYLTRELAQPCQSSPYTYPSLPIFPLSNELYKACTEGWCYSRFHKC